MKQKLIVLSFATLLLTSFTIPRAEVVTYATFIAQRDCYVGVRADVQSAWGTTSLAKGKSWRKEVPNGKRLLYGTGLASNQPGSLVINPKGSVGQGETVYVP